MSRPIPDPPEGFAPFINGYDLQAAGYMGGRQDGKLRAYAEGAWRPISYVPRINRRSIDTNYRTGDGFVDTGSQRLVPERVAAPCEILTGLTAVQLHRGDVIIAGPVPAELLAQIGECAPGSVRGGEPRIHMTIRTRDGGRELCSRPPDAGPFTVRRILPANRAPGAAR